MIEFQTVDVQKIETESAELVKVVSGFQIVSDEIYVEAMEFAKKIKASIKEVEEAFDPIIKQNHAAWKGAIAQKDKYLAPRQKALSYLDEKARTFRLEQRRKQEEEQRKLRELQEKEAERLKKLKENAEERGDTQKAELFSAKAEEIKSAVPVVASPEIPKVAGITIKKIWKFRIVDLSLVPREYMIPNETMLGQVARSTKGALKIPGVEIYSEDSKL